MAKFDELSPQRQQAILLLTEQIINPDAPRLKYSEIAERVGVTERTLFNWRTSDKAFMEARKELVDKYADEMISDAFMALRYQLKTNKNVRAAETVLRSRGMLYDNQKITVETSTEDGEQSVNKLKEMLNPTTKLEAGTIKNEPENEQ